MGFEVAATAAFVSAGFAQATAATLAAVTTSVATSLAASTAIALLQRALSEQTVVKRQGSRLTESRITNSAEGAAMFNAYGSMRLGGQLIWATSFIERRRSDKVRSGSGKNRKVVGKNVSYRYSTSFAVAICESEGDLTLGKIWADGKLLDQEDYAIRFYDGSLSQQPDPKIQSVEGSANTPAYRGVAYVVFEDMPLGDFGNRIPQITCEVIRAPVFDIGVTIQTLCSDVGLTPDQIDITGISGLSDQITGFYNDAIVSPSALLEVLMETYQIDVYEEGGKLVFVRRADAPSFEIDESDLVLREEESFVKTRSRESDLPDRMKVEFIDASRSYNMASVDSHSVTGLSRSVGVFTTSAVMTQSYALNLADSILHERHVGRNQVSFTLPFSSESSGMNYLSVVRPGKIFSFDGRTYRVRSLSYGDDIEVDAVGYDPSVYVRSEYADSPDLIDNRITPGETTAIFMDIPVTDASIPALWSPRIAVDAQPWPGSVQVYREDGSGGYVLNSELDLDSETGLTVNALPAGTPWQWDETSALTVNMTDDVTLLNETEFAVLNGANTLLIETPSGEWEVLQFVNATLEADGTYTLTKLLRGQLGTEAYMGDPTPGGARVVVYDPDRFGFIEGNTSLLGVDVALRHGPETAPVDDPTYTNVTVTPRGVAYRPFAPTHLRQFNDGSDITLSWIRRARFDGDSWQTVTVPLNEDFERYEIDIYDDATVVRTITVDDATSVTYSAAQQVEDFGAEQQTVKWVVHQISAIYGRGSPATQEA